MYQAVCQVLEVKRCPSHSSSLKALQSRNGDIQINFKKARVKVITAEIELSIAHRQETI